MSKEKDFQNKEKQSDTTTTITESTNAEAVTPTQIQLPITTVTVTATPLANAAATTTATTGTTIATTGTKTPDLTSTLVIQENFKKTTTTVILKNLKDSLNKSKEKQEQKQQQQKEKQKQQEEKNKNEDKLLQVYCRCHEVEEEQEPNQIPIAIPDQEQQQEDPEQELSQESKQDHNEEEDSDEDDDDDDNYEDAEDKINKDIDETDNKDEAKVENDKDFHDEVGLVTNKKNDKCEICGRILRNSNKNENLVLLANGETSLKASLSSLTSSTTTATISLDSPLNGLTQAYESIINEDYPLHKCVFLDNYKLLSYLLQKPPKNWKLREILVRKDKHGNTALHLAVMLGRKKCISSLLAHDAPVKVKNNDGWSPLSEAISYGDRGIITVLLRKLKHQSRAHMEERRNKLINALKQMKDFYMELKWDFQSWLPLVSRMLPSDICRIHKSGGCLRLDTTLVDFNDMKWERGDISFIFRGDKGQNESLTVMDNEYECYQHVRYEDSDIEDEVDVLMSTDIINAQMSTKSINFQRAQSGWIFREHRKEIVSGQYQCDLYTIQGLILKQKKRREHLSNEDLQKNRAMVDSFTKGRRSSLNNSDNSTTTTTVTSINANANANSNKNNGASSNVEIPQRRNSLQPPPATTITWEQYLSTPIGKCPALGRPPVHKQSNKTFRATVAMSEDFPLSVDMLLNVLEVIAPFKHLNKLREFITLKLPAGFPVKVEIPVLHTVTAKITFQKFEFRDNISEKLFEIPSNYIEDARRFPDL